MHLLPNEMNSRQHKPHQSIRSISKRKKSLLKQQPNHNSNVSSSITFPTPKRTTCDNSSVDNMTSMALVEGGGQCQNDQVIDNIDNNNNNNSDNNNNNNRNDCATGVINRFSTRSASLALAAVATVTAAQMYSVESSSSSLSSSLSSSSSSAFSSSSPLSPVSLPVSSSSGVGHHGMHHHHSFSHPSHSAISSPLSAASGHSLSSSLTSSSLTSPTSNFALNYPLDSSSTGLANTVRRISLNILNTSSSAFDSLRSAVVNGGGGSSAAAHSKPTSNSMHNSLLAHHHQSEDSKNSVISGSNSEADGLALTTSRPTTGTSLTSTYSYLTDIFPRLLPKSLSFSLQQPSSYSNNDYDDDYLSSSSSSLSSANAETANSYQSMKHSSDQSSESDSSDMLLMRLMRNVMNSSPDSNSASAAAFSSPVNDHHRSQNSVYLLSDLSPSNSLLGPSSSLSSLSSSVAAVASPSSSFPIVSFSSASALTSSAASAISSATALLSNGTMPNDSSVESNFFTSAPAGDSLNLSSNSQMFATMGTTISASDIASNALATISDFEMTSTAVDAFNGGPLDWLDIVIIVLKVIILGTIIFSAIFGNMLVIISVFRHHRLRITTNYFIVSLAFADILVAVFAMTFNASVVIAGRWVFNMVICDFWNSCDVLFSTASIMHLSCISYDRYYAIIKPLDYPMKITTKRVGIMITCVWISSALISYIPIFTGIYTTQEAIEDRQINTENCEWIVNIPYALISSTVSFWLPCGFMLTAYYKIYREAIKQEKFIYKTQQMGNTMGTNHHHHHNQSNQTKSNNNNKQSNAQRHSSASDTNNVIQIQSAPHRNSHGDDPESGSSTPTKRTISKMKREHKAAKTLGIIMGAFILCWLPFFIWYVASTICGSNCNTPKLIVDILFWVGYLNSAMNPIIYAYFNRDFREAFKETLRNIFCCCFGFRCLEAQRNEVISFSCTYRSTMDVGLVENKYVKD